VSGHSGGTAISRGGTLDTGCETPFWNVSDYVHSRIAAKYMYTLHYSNITPLLNVLSVLIARNSDKL